MAKDKMSIEDHERAVRLEIYRKNAKEAATDFKYGDDVIARIIAAKTENEISSIMYNARYSS